MPVQFRGRKRVAGAGFLAAAGAPKIAFAAGLEVASPVWGYLLAGIVAALAVALLLRRRKAEDDTIESAPVGLVWWARGNSGITGPARDLLGIDNAANLSALANIFSDRDAPEVSGILGALREQGKPFAGRYRTRAGKEISLTGRRVASRDLVWVGAPAIQSVETAALRALIDRLPMPVWWRRPDMDLAGCNAAYAAALDCDVETVLRDRRELGAGYLDRDGRSLARRAMNTESAQSESHHIIVGGRRRLYEFSEMRLGEQTGIVGGYATDVTMIEDVQSDLASHVAAHAEVLESLWAAIAIYGPDQRLKFFNSAFLEMWNIDAEALHGEPSLGDVLEVLRERRRLPEYLDFQSFKQETAALFNTLIEPREELLHLPDERTLRMIVSSHPMGGLMFVYENVTDSLALERSYNTLTEVQRETLDNLHEAVTVFGADGRLKLWNVEAAVMWNLPMTEASLDTHIGDILEETRAQFPPVDDWAARKQRLILAVTEPKPQSGRLRRIDGRIIDYNCVPLPDGGCLLGYIDVTDGARVQQALEERNLALEAADRMKSDFIANVSYELRTPLNAIIGFTEILDNRYFGELTARQGEYVQSVLQASNHLMALINDIIDLATIEAGYLTLELGTVNVHDALVNLLPVFRKRAGDSGLELNFDCPADIGTIVADERRVRQAIYNLITNAVQFTPEGGTVTLSARREPDGMTIAVADTGIGIAPEDTDRMLEKFERGQGDSREYGAGLGLALVKNLIELHGGSITVQSELGKGTRIECRLPLNAMAKNAVAESTEAVA
ncbi:MAG: ATP-binding protein [Alphaproteobacteria bacterium]